MGREKSVLEITLINVKEQCKEKKGWRGQLGLLQTNFKDVVIIMYFLLSCESFVDGPRAVPSLLFTEANWNCLIWQLIRHHHYYFEYLYR